MQESDTALIEASVRAEHRHGSGSERPRLSAIVGGPKLREVPHRARARKVGTRAYRDRGGPRIHWVRAGRKIVTVEKLQKVRISSWIVAILSDCRGHFLDRHDDLRNGIPSRILDAVEKPIGEERLRSILPVVIRRGHESSLDAVELIRARIANCLLDAARNRVTRCTIL